MKFQKGSKVEVMNKTELPTSWCVAQVVSGKKHTYNLRYNCYPGIEKVSREFIRPCPPPNATTQHWVAGDIVEVFDDSSWKTATVCNVSHEGHFLIRIHGFTHETIVYESNIRARQSWQHEKWIPIVKISGSYGDVNASQMVEPNCPPNFGWQIPLPDGNNCKENASDILIYNDGGLQDSHCVSSKSLKRASPFCSSHPEASPKKLKASDQSLEKVEDKKLQASSYNTVKGFYEPEKEHISKTNDSKSDQCSVGSCSVSIEASKVWSSPYNIANETDIRSSDAESYNTSRDVEEGKYSPTPEEGVTQGIQKLELHAYRSTLEAFYVSGPLSWEKEALLTNLRINLHISNDQHLTELKRLISAGVGI